MPPVVQCYKCGTQNQLGMRFCITCGEKFAYNCPQCNNITEPGATNCAVCGVRLDWGNQTNQRILSPLEKSPPDIPVSPANDRVKKTLSTSRKGINPWLIAFIMVVVLIIAVIVIDSIV